MKLRQKVLLVFTITLVLGAGLVYITSRRIVVSSFRQLERQQMERDVEFAISGLDLEFRNLADSANDYAYWDRMYEYMLNPKKADISGEFLDNEMAQLNFSLVVIRNTQGEIVFLHSYNPGNPGQGGPSREFLRGIFALEPMGSEAIAMRPQDGLIEFPDGPYIVSLRPILTSRRSGQSRGVFMLARKFEEGEIGRLTSLTRTSISFEPIDSGNSPDFSRARAELRAGDREVEVIPLSERVIAGYAMLADIFRQPLLLMRVETPRPIYERGKLDQRYLFGTILAGAVMFSVVILFCMQRFVLSRIGKLNRDVNNIGEHRGTFEPVEVSGRDELTGLGNSINAMLDELRTAHFELEARVALRTGELAERGELVKLLLDSSPSAMYGVNMEGVCTFCNPAALRLLGYDQAVEILGKNIHTLMHPTRRDGSAYPQQEWPIMASLQGGEDAHIVEETFWRKNGESFVGEYSSRRIRRNDLVVGAVVTFVDTTNRKHREMEANHGQKLEAVGRLAAGIAHEINTPVQFVSDNVRFLQNAFKDQLSLIEKYQRLVAGAAESLASPAMMTEAATIEGDADWPYMKEEIPRAIEQAMDGLQRVATIVRGMKEFSHVDRSNEKAPADINRALESTLIVARNELKYVAEVEAEYGELPLVNCHLGDLNQVFLNLMVNAAHAIEEVVKGTETRGKIQIATRMDGDWVEIAIRDSGTGIAEEVRHKIFDPFFSTKEVGKGTGQGLALARNVVVDKHGGTLTFATAMGKGTTFLIRLPIQAALVPVSV